MYNHYAFFEKSINWNTANDYCQTVFGTHLATSTSDEENRYQKARVVSDTWIGFEDIDTG